MTPAALPGALDRLACADLATRFFHHLDRGEFQALSGLFAQDGVWLRQGVELVGAAAILDAMATRPSGLVTRHLLSNVVVDLGPTEVATIGYDVQVFAQTDGSAARLTQILTGADTFVCTDGRWKIARKAAKPVFLFPAPARP